MAKRSGFLVRQKARELAREALVRQIVGQFDTDTAIIALCEVFGFGYERQIRFLNAWQKKREEYVGAMFPKADNEADVKQEHLDSELREDETGKYRIIMTDSVTSIDGSAFTGTDAVIMAPAGSYAETWAELNGVPFAGT